VAVFVGGGNTHENEFVCHYGEYRGVSSSTDLRLDSKAV
jgi:hypothetical protein